MQTVAQTYSVLQQSKAGKCLPASMPAASPRTPGASSSKPITSKANRRRRCDMADRRATRRAVSALGNRRNSRHCVDVGTKQECRDLRCLALMADHTADGTEPRLGTGRPCIRPTSAACPWAVPRHRPAKPWGQSPNAASSSTRRAIFQPSRLFGGAISCSDQDIRASAGDRDGDPRQPFGA